MRNGTEPIFIEKDEEPLVDLIQKIVKSYLNLNKQDRLVVKNFFTNLLNEISNDTL